MAEILNEHRYHGGAEHERARDLARAAKAAEYLIAVTSRYLAWCETTSKALPPPHEILPEAAYDILRNLRLLLVEALPIFRPFGETGPTPMQATWFGESAGGAERLALLIAQASERRHLRAAAKACGVALPGPPWLAAAVIVWMVARDALAELGRSAGTSPNAIAVKFVGLAMAKLGFGPIEPAAVSKQLRRLKWLTEE
jgi:hypothetical protein